jgi:hypothetical protein
VQVEGNPFSVDRLRGEIELVALESFVAIQLGVVQEPGGIE